MNLRACFAIPAPLRDQIRITAAAFIVLAVVGYVGQLLFPDALTPLFDLLSALAVDTGAVEADGGELMVGILVNNLSALFLAMLLGLIPFLRLPAMELGLNATLFGAMGSYYRQNGMSLAAYLAGTLPHGITELSALVLSCAAGLHICRTVTDSLLRRGEKGAAGQAVRDGLLLYARFIVPLLLISAFIEAFLTPALLARFL